MKIAHLTLHTNSLKATKQFYTTTLQLPLLNLQSNSLTLQAGETKLTFIEVEEPVNAYHFAFNIPSNKLIESLAWGEENLNLIKNIQGNLVTTFENWNAQSVYFFDNNNNLVEFIAREDIGIVSAEPFSPSEIINISEIGIVTENPIQQADQLIEQHNLLYFTKAEPTPQFLAIGDDDALLIFVVPKRNWYPTNIEAKPTYAKIEISHNERTIVLNSLDFDVISSN